MSRLWLTDPKDAVFTYPRRFILAAVMAVTFGLFSTSTLPAMTGGTGQALAKKKTKKKTKKKVARSAQS